MTEEEWFDSMINEGDEEKRENDLIDFTTRMEV